MAVHVMGHVPPGTAGGFRSRSLHLGECASGFDQDADGVEFRFTSGRSERADLVVFADGIGSANRRQFSPEARREYAGYVDWRGLVFESRLSAGTFELLHDSVTDCVAPGTHVPMYPILSPEGGLAVGERSMNYVWYRNVAVGDELDELMTDKRGVPAEVSLHPGQVQDQFVEECVRRQPICWHQRSPK